MIVNGHQVADGTPGPGRGNARRGRSDSLGVHTSYESAQRVVTTLSEHGFPQWRTCIVGRDLNPLHAVVGRLSASRAILAGAAGGAGVAVLIRVAFVFATAFSVFPLLIAVLLGTGFGALLGAVAHWTVRRRCSGAAPCLTAHRYEVLIDADLAERARQVLHDPAPRATAMYPSEARAFTPPAG